MTLALLAALALPQDPPLKPVLEIPLKGSVEEILLSPDRAWILVVDLSEGKLRRVEAATGRIDDTALDLGGTDARVRAAADGRTLFVYARATDAEAPKKETPSAYRGRLQILDVAAFQTRSSFELPLLVRALAVGERNLVYCVGTDGRRAQTAVVDTSRKTIVNRWIKATGHQLFTSADRKRVYAADSGVSAFQVPKDPSKDDLLHAGSRSSFGGFLTMTPDGAWMVSNSGSVARLSNTDSADLVVVKTVEAHAVSAADPSRNLLWTADAERRLRVYRIPSFELLRTFPLPEAPYRLALDAPGKRLIAAMSKDPATSRDGMVRPYGVGDVHVYDLASAYPDLPEPK